KNRFITMGTPWVAGAALHADVPAQRCPGFRRTPPDSTYLILFYRDRQLSSRRAGYFPAAAPIFAQIF
ncbi:hypothetical protein, partial [Ligaoa zhengdingensis]